jgi:hypothetical protein
MNAQATTDIRELTTQEIDQVTGGESALEIGLWAGLWCLGAGTVLGALLSWIFE